jgi:hypothetical protein
MNRFWKAVILTWLFVGTLDLTAAYVSQWIKTGKFASKLLQYIAGGVIGLDRSLQGGNAVEFLGLFIHYLIAFCFTLFFFWIFPKVKVLHFNKWVVGALYGIFANLVVWLVINLFSQLPGSPFILSNFLVPWLILILALGIPIAYNAYRFYGVKDEDLWRK